MSGSLNKPTLSAQMTQRAGYWGQGAEKHSAFYWLSVLAAAFVIVIVILVILQV